MDLFKDIQLSARLDNSSDLHLDTLHFVFLPMIDKELELVKEEWNTHVIRHSRYFDSPPGIPNALYFFPDLKGSHCFKCSVTEEQLCEVKSREVT
jgi:hypothetical protein